MQPWEPKNAKSSKRYFNEKAMAAASRDQQEAGPSGVAEKVKESAAFGSAAAAKESIIVDDVMDLGLEILKKSLEGGGGTPSEGGAPHGHREENQREAELAAVPTQAEK